MYAWKTLINILIVCVVCTSMSILIKACKKESQDLAIPLIKRQGRSDIHD